jgi:L-amino acid N-acyltransferase YncA
MIATRNALSGERAARLSRGCLRPAARIRPVTTEDFPAKLRIFRRVIASGDTNVCTDDMSAKDVHDYWFTEALTTYVAELDGRVMGMYRIIENQRGRGSHVANASVMVDPDARGLGLGRSLGEHLLSEAKMDGFLAMQANLVVSTDTRAVALCRQLDLVIVGTLPRAFRHAQQGLVDAYVMYCPL